MPVEVGPYQAELLGVTYTDIHQHTNKATRAATVPAKALHLNLHATLRHHLLQRFLEGLTRVLRTIPSGILTSPTVSV